jgi:hypothetical protein
VRGLVVLLLLVTLCGCTHHDTSASPTGCGIVPATDVVGLLGRHATSTPTGSLDALRNHHRPAGCRVTVTGHPERYVTVRATYHPAPLPLPAHACSEGWVVAGTPAKAAPACQDTVDGHGRTRLIARWQPYLVRVTIGRSGRDWAGDPEIALAMSRALARRLHVSEAQGES